jgi:hypothetical protein
MYINELKYCSAADCTGDEVFLTDDCKNKIPLLL